MIIRMKRTVALIGVLAAVGVGAAIAQQSAPVETKGQHGRIKIEHVVAGYLSELNGKYKLRVGEVTLDPNGSFGPHHHAWPGIRCITAGELTSLLSGKSTVYHADDCFFDPGDVTHSAHNATDKPVVLLIFDILPASESGGSVIPAPK